MPAQFAFIDNNPETIADELKAALGKKNVAIIQFPDDFDSQHAATSQKSLDDCCVVLMDLELYENAPKPSFGLTPVNGLVLEEIIRSWLNESGQKMGKGRTAFVLFSHKLENLGSETKRREHVLARKTGNEWVTSKNENDRPVIHKDLSFLKELATAVEKLRGDWPEDTNEAKKKALSLLGISPSDGEDWRMLAAADAERFGLPVQEITNGHKMALVRWLLHIALPFPSALSDIDDVAVALRLDPASFENATLRERMECKLAEFEYAGLLKNFLGKRWWNAGVTKFILDLSGKAGGRREELWEAVAKSLDAKQTDLKTSGFSDPVLVVDDQFRRTKEVHDSSDCVRIITDDWPSALEHPWMTIQLAQSSSRLRSLVHPDDSYRLD